MDMETEMELRLGLEVLVSRIMFEVVADDELSAGSVRVEAMITSLLAGEEPAVFQFSPWAERLAARYRDSVYRFRLYRNARRRREEGGMGE